MEQGRLHLQYLKPLAAQLVAHVPSNSKLKSKTRLRLLTAYPQGPAPLCAKWSRQGGGAFLMDLKASAML